MGYRGKKVLVTGADGFIGSHLTEMLVSQGAEVTALSFYNSFDSHGWLDDIAEPARSKICGVRGDIRDAAFVRRIVAGQEVVFHLAALIAIPHSYVAAQSYVETNILGTLHVLEAVRDSCTTRVVHTSTSEVYGSALTLPIAETHPLQGQSPYSASKVGADMLVESFVRSFELPIAVLRPFNSFGPRQSERAVIPTVLRQMLDPACNVVEIGDLSTVRDFTFVADTAAAFLALGSAPGVAFGRPYNAGTGISVSVSELIELAAELAGCTKPVQQKTGRMRPNNSEVRALLADSRRIAADAGWRPSVDLRTGLARTIEWWRNRFARGLVRHRSDFMT